jgi:flavin-dependent dehydrogenase
MCDANGASCTCVGLTVGEYQARMLIAADGSESNIARKLGLVTSPANSTVTVALLPVRQEARFGERRRILFAAAVS